MKPYYQDGAVTIYHGDVLNVLSELPADYVQCVVTSPPYWGLRDYGIDGQSGRNIRSVWTIATQPYPEAHFATFPEDLVKPCILAGSRPGDIVCDPFAGSGTALYVAKELGRKGIGVELKADYIDLAAKRMSQEVLAL